MQGGWYLGILSTAGTALLIGACGGTPEQPPTPPAPTVSLASYDDFNKDLAARVVAVLSAGAGSEFQVVATPVHDPIGTLYRNGRSVAWDDTSCRPAQMPEARNMPTAFPAYSFGSTLAGELGIDSGVLQGVASAGASVAREASFTFSVGGPQLQVLTEAALKALVAVKACREAILKDMVLVRGYVTGQRTFLTSGKLTAGANAGVVKVGSLKIDVSSNGTVTISDDVAQAFLQVITAVEPIANASTPVKFSVPAQMAGAGRIYIQQDRSDDSSIGRGLVKSLQSAGLGEVEPRVELTTSARTPREAQVRYFHDADKARAIEVLRRLQQQYPTAKLVPIKIPAPPGQLEVWLPRVK